MVWVSHIQSQLKNLYNNNMVLLAYGWKYIAAPPPIHLIKYYRNMCTCICTVDRAVRFRMDTSVFGGSNSVPVRLKWLIWTVGSYSIYRECVRSDIESARETMLLLEEPIVD